MYATYTRDTILKIVNIPRVSEEVSKQEINEKYASHLNKFLLTHPTNFKTHFPLYPRK